MYFYTKNYVSSISGKPVKGSTEKFVLQEIESEEDPVILETESKIAEERLLSSEQMETIKTIENIIGKQCSLNPVLMESVQAILTLQFCIFRPANATEKIYTSACEKNDLKNSALFTSYFLITA